MATDWAADLGLDRLTPSTWPGATPASAHERLRRFAADSLAGYELNRDLPEDEDGTSRLSAALKLGTISVREVARAVVKRGAADPRSRPGAEELVRQLAWRDYGVALLHADPSRLGEPARADAAARAVGPHSAERLAAWREGRTGLPLVDAGMRQLRAEGWMPHRLRVLAASVLAHQLECDWRAGERHFIENLVDLDLAGNDLGWRLAVGTGVPRNPQLEGERIDPGGAYVRRWVPELADVPSSHIHRPWAMPEELGASMRRRAGIGYPEPIVPPAMEET